MSTIIDLQNITKSYTLGNQHLQVLKAIYFTVQKGEFVSIMGASGSGKSTLMNIIGLLDRHDGGRYMLNNKELKEYSDDALAMMRNKMIGFVFQQFFLLPKLTAIQNVSLPLLYRGLKGEQANKLSREVLEKVEMGQYCAHKPSQLSGGQQQRVAIARALVTEPAVILADEPTGALDSKTSQEVIHLFKELNKQFEATIILITHDPHVAKQAQRIVHINDGCIES